MDSTMADKRAINSESTRATERTKNFVGTHLLWSQMVMMKLREEKLIMGISTTTDDLVSRLRTGGKIMTCGCGGSAADSHHLTTELVGRYQSPGRRPLPSICLASDPVLLTALANDFGFELVFAKQVEALAVPGDVLVALSTSGRSESVIRALWAARRSSVTTVGITGEECWNQFVVNCDHLIVLPSNSTPMIQQMTTVVIHAMCAVIDEAFKEESTK